MGKIENIRLEWFFWGILFFSLYTSAVESKESRKPISYAPEKGIEWVQKCIERYPEILWLATANVRKTEEGCAAEKELYSVQIFGKKFIEFDRTIANLECLKLLIEGTWEAYEVFTAVQKQRDKLSFESFCHLHREIQNFLNSRYERIFYDDLVMILETGLVLGDVGKSEQARALFRPFGAAAPDHDDFHEELMKILEMYPSMCPSFAKLSEAGRKLLQKRTNLAHFGHITHLEGTKEMFTKLKQSEIAFKDPPALTLALLIHTCNVAGAGGHISKGCSLFYTEETHRAIEATKRSVRIFRDPTKTGKDAYNQYLSERASWLGLDPSEQIDRVLTRFGAMMRLFSKEDGLILRQAALEWEKKEAEKIVAQFDPKPEDALARVPTYMPAVLLNLRGVFNDLKKAILLGPPYLAIVLETRKEDIKKERADPNIPLNFNPIAGIVKENPMLLEKAAFQIDSEGNVFHLFEK